MLMPNLSFSIIQNMATDYLATNITKAQVRYICPSPNSMLYFHQATSESGNDMKENGKEESFGIITGYLNTEKEQVTQGRTQ